jgi:hypothetical protein
VTFPELVAEMVAADIAEIAKESHVRELVYE